MMTTLLFKYSLSHNKCKFVLLEFWYMFETYYKAKTLELDHVAKKKYKEVFMNLLIVLWFSTGFQQQICSGILLFEFLIEWVKYLNCASSKTIFMDFKWGILIKKGWELLPWYMCSRINVPKDQHYWIF